MADEQQPPENQQQKSDLFGQMSNIEPPREVPELPETEDGDGEDENATLEERMNVRKLSDMQTADLRLFPDLGAKHLNHVMVSRVFPDVYNPMLMLYVKDLLQQHPEMSMTEAIAEANTAMSIAIDGEGRIDELGLAGVSHQEEMQKEKTKLGELT